MGRILQYDHDHGRDHDLKKMIKDYVTLFSVSLQRSHDYDFHGRDYDSMEGNLRAEAVR